MQYIKISRYELGEKKYNLLGSYIQPIDQLLNAIDGELYCDIEVGTKITLEVIEMSIEEFKALPEFQGY